MSSVLDSVTSGSHKDTTERCQAGSFKIDVCSLEQKYFDNYNKIPGKESEKIFKNLITLL